MNLRMVSVSGPKGARSRLAPFHLPCSNLQGIDTTSGETSANSGDLGVDRTQGAAPSCIDWAALSAIAGDHSCSAAEMTATVLESRWILSVADIAGRLKGGKRG